MVDENKQITSETARKCQLACQVAEKRLDYVWSAIDSVDTKINVSLGFGSGILGLLAGFYALQGKSWPTTSLVLFSIATAAYLALAILSIYAYKTSDWSVRPHIPTLSEYCQNDKKDFETISTWLVNEYQTSLKDNQTKLAAKGNQANWGLVLLVIETVFLTSGLISALFH